MKFSSVATFGLLTLAGQAMAAVRVMPLGASIVTRCWRANLIAKLRNNGVTNMDFVGSQRSTNCAGIVGNDQDHEGHPGSLVTDYAKNNNVTGWLNQNPADVIVFFMGHNDIIIGKKTNDQIIAAYDTVIAQIRQKKPNMQIVFSSLTPVDPARWSAPTADQVKSLGGRIATWAPSKSTRQSPVYFVDNLNTGYNPVTNTDDGLHPTNAGNEIMAKAFITNTQKAIKAVTGAQRKRETRWQAVQRWIEEKL